MLNVFRRRYLDLPGSIYIYNGHRGCTAIGRVRDAGCARCPENTGFIAAADRQPADGRKHYLMLRGWFGAQGRLWQVPLGSHARHVVWLVAAMVAACVPAGDLRREYAPTPVFDPVAFFAGETEGRGTLTIVLRRPQPTLVEGRGTVAPNGTLTLEQEVSRGGRAPTHRTWRLHRIGADRYAGSLTDATGPVVAEVAGNRLHIGFAMKGGLRAQQWLYLAADGKSARNRMVITKVGVPVASLDEEIVRKS